MTDQPDLQQRIADALCDANPLLAGYSRRVEEYTDAVLPVVRAELDQARADFGAALETEAANCAREIDRAKQAEAELEQLRAAQQRVWEIAERWAKYGTTDLRTAARILRTDVLDGPVADQQPTTEGDPQ